MNIRDEWMIKALDVTRAYENAIIDILIHNKPRTKACSEQGIDKADLAKFIETLRFDIVSRRIPKNEIDQIHMLSGWEKLYVQMSGVKDLKEIPVDCDETFEYVIKTLPKREQLVLKERYIGCLILDDVAAHFNITRERVRQIEAKAIRRLRTPNRWKYIKYGKTAYENFIKMREKAIEEASVSEYVSKIEAAAQNMVDHNDIEALKVLRTEIDNYIHKENPLNDEGIEVLDLSVRSYNCLKRANITNLKDLSRITYSQLMKIRNLGRKSFYEILDKCTPFGINIVDDTQPEE